MLFVHYLHVLGNTMRTYFTTETMKLASKWTCLSSFHCHPHVILYKHTDKNDCILVPSYNLELKGNSTNFTHHSVYYCICKQSCIKPFVAAEDAECNLMNWLQLCHLVAMLHSSILGTRFWKAYRYFLVHSRSSSSFRKHGPRGGQYNLNYVFLFCVISWHYKNNGNTQNILPLSLYFAV